jgi:hypothetical protein
VALQKLKPVDIQFTEVKLRRLNEELDRTRKTVNSVIDVLGQAESAGGAFEHALVGSSHTAEGLTPGTVLMALTAEVFGFRTMQIDDLEDVATGGATDGQTLVRSGGVWVAQDLPGVAGLVDPGADYIVFWNESVDDLDFLLLGTGLVIAGGMLVLDTSAIDHGNLAGLTDDDHPQYPLITFPETISGDWSFTGALTFERAAIDLTFRETAADPTEIDWTLMITGAQLELALDDGVGEGQSVLRVARAGSNITELSLAEFLTLIADEDGEAFISADYGAYEGAVLHSFYGDVQLLDEGALYIGEAGEISFRFDETDTHLTTTGDVYWQNSATDEAIGATLNLEFERIEMRGAAPEFILTAEEAEENEGAWGQRAEFGLLQLAAFNDDGSIAEAWASITNVGGVIEEIAFNAGLVTINGVRVLTEDDLP